MNGKERVRRAIEHDNPDRVPYDGILPWRSDVFYVVALTPRSWQPPKGMFPQVEPLMMQTGRWKWTSYDPTMFPNSGGKPPKAWWTGNGLGRDSWETVDEWGAYWNHIASDPSMGHPGRTRIDSWDKLDEIRIPDAKSPKRYALFKKLLKLFPRKYKCATNDHFIFERTHFYRGFANVLVDMRRNPAKLKALISKVTGYWLDAVEMAGALKVDGISVPDDLGDQKSAFMSPAMFKEFWFEPYRKIIKLCHDYGMHFELHSCGAINDLVPLLVEAGVDVFQFDAPHMTGIDFQAGWADRVAFKNVVDIQKIYPFAKPAEIEAEVKFMISKLATHHGGLIGRDYPDAHRVLHVPKENIKAARVAFKKWGKYPLSWIK